ncbi:tetratricopeptide repeat protein [Komagataeibacter medellinensis]|uniref:Tetratricopeptide repeat protein n=1 Tax=Komagataeibacter medellinensis TaxID=1177712 RepID=A0ABQ6VV08_9PROT|nr:tetratricopeptide repeat protein [Komagataeibacter medellinensis]KAB8124020.1 tetratricopeptide repeat protein [Komagataeibacter medellinensis]
MNYQLSPYHRHFLFPTWIRRIRARKIIRLANQARDARQWSLATENFHEALKQVPHRYDLWVQYGHALKESGLIIDAELSYRIALHGNPECADTYLQLGHVLKLQNRLAEAKAAYQEASRLDPNLSKNI